MGRPKLQKCASVRVGDSGVTPDASPATCRGVPGVRLNFNFGVLYISFLIRFNSKMSFRLSKNWLLSFSFLFLVVSILLTGCSSSSTEESLESSEPYFDNVVYGQDLRTNANSCDFNFSSSDHPQYLWSSKKQSESDKYSWIEYNSISDYYEFRLEDPSYAEYDLGDVTDAKKCIEFLSNAIEELKVFEIGDAVSLKRLYGDALANREAYLVQAELMTSIEITKANRAKYLEVEGAKRGLSDAIELMLPEIRELIDFFYYGSVKVFLERCPDAYSVSGNDTVNSGFVLLTNTSNSTEKVALTVRFKDSEGVLVGDDSIIESVPGNSKVRAEISATGSSGAVISGYSYPPRCTLENYG